MGLTFTATTMKNGKPVEVPLIPNGSHTAVTKDNLYKYIILLANYKLNKIIDKPCEYFRAGLCHLVDPELLAMFNQVLLIFCLISCFRCKKLNRTSYKC